LNTDPIKVYDARWEPAEFDAGEVARLVESTLIYGRILGVDAVTICRDARWGCAPLMELAVDMAQASGFDVFLCPDPVSTPQSYFLTFTVAEERPTVMGLTFTASHNPASYVGLKVVVPPVQAIGLDCGPLGGFRKIREIYHGTQALERGRRSGLRVLSVAREYVDFSLAQAGVAEGGLAGLTLVADFMNGSAGPEFMAAFQRAQVSAVPLRLVPDGGFPTGSPNPTSAGKMAAAVALARAEGADAVIGTDGDGDRLVFGDARGVLSAGIAAIPVLSTVAASGGGSAPPSVLYDPKVSPLALSAWARAGAAPVLFRNGHSQIKERMRSVDALAAVEESGHFYHRLRGARSAAYMESSLVTALLFLKALRERPALRDELRALEDSFFTTGEFNYRLPNDAERDGALAAALRLFRDDGAALASRTDDGSDLMGTYVSKGIDARTGALSPDWYQAYLRVATNEKAVMRSYLSSGDPSIGRLWETRLRGLLESRGGRVVE
jgi:phosphomannomutase